MPMCPGLLFCRAVGLNLGRSDFLLITCNAVLYLSSIYRI